MKVWDVSSASGHSQTADSITNSLIQCIGAADFNTHLLAYINQIAPVASWSVYRLAPNRPLGMHISGSYEVPDTTRQCWLTYCRKGLYRNDTTFMAARRRARPNRLLMGHWVAADIHPLHRDHIYIRHGLRERVSLFSVDQNGDLLAINLYRHDHQPAFQPGELIDLRALATIISACVRRHIDLYPAMTQVSTPPQPHACSLANESPPAGAHLSPPSIRVPLNAVSTQHGSSPPAAEKTPTLGAHHENSFASTLKALCPALTRRELQVCERLLQGYTHDGVAADLGLAVSTVKTYRNRAFSRLGIRFRSELFARVIQAQQPQASSKPSA